MKIVPDKIDQQILDQLRQDPRITIRQIAKNIGVSHATVQRHFSQLTEEKLINIILLPNPLLLYEFWVQFHIKVEYSEVSKVSQTLLKYDRFFAISECFGAYEILASAFFSSLQEMADFIKNTLWQIKEIKSIDYCCRTKVLRFYNASFYEE